MMNTDTSPALDRLLSWSLRHPLPASLGYATAFVLIVAVGLFRALVVSSIVPWLLFIPAVLMIALVFGRGPGFFAGGLAAIVAGVSIGNAREPFWLTLPQWTGSLIFVLIASGIAILAAELRALFAHARELVADKEAVQATLVAVFENAPVGLSLADANGGSVLLNEQMRRMLGRDISHGGIDRYLSAGAIHADGSSYILAEYPQVEAIRNGVKTMNAPFLIERPDGSRLRTEISSVPLRNSVGSVVSAVSVVVDVEAREQALEHHVLLTGELAHRMKNTMAMVQAIVHQSLRSATTLAEARETVVSRFEALVRAQDLLTQADWKLTDLASVAHGALETVNQDSRLHIEGCLVEVGARAALSFTLVLHELATNAVKYGALSVPEGRVYIRWNVRQVGTDHQVRLTWQEVDGPEVALPSRKGFGTRLIDTIGRTFGGRSELIYEPSGVCWLVEADIARLKAA